MTGPGGGKTSGPADRSPAGSGRSDTPARAAPRPTARRYAAAAAVWAVTVPQAEPAMPQCRPSTNVAFRMMLTMFAATATASGVRVSCRPRSTPVPASTASMDGAPIRLIRR